MNQFNWNIFDWFCYCILNVFSGFVFPSSLARYWAVSTSHTSKMFLPPKNHFYLFSEKCEFELWSAGVISILATLIYLPFAFNVQNIGCISGIHCISGFRFRSVRMRRSMRRFSWFTGNKSIYSKTNTFLYSQHFSAKQLHRKVCYFSVKCQFFAGFFLAFCSLLDSMRVFSHRQFNFHILKNYSAMSVDCLD